MTPPAASAPSPTVEEGMREAVARAIYDVGNKALATALWDGWEPLPIEQDERTYRLHLEYADALLSGDGPIASALAARERERDEARAERDRARTASAQNLAGLHIWRRQAERFETELATLRASAERMEAEAEARGMRAGIGDLLDVARNLIAAEQAEAEADAVCQATGRALMGADRTRSELNDLLTLNREANSRASKALSVRQHAVDEALSTLRALATAAPAETEERGTDWHWTATDGKPRKDDQGGEQWLLTWSEGSATADIACIDGDWLPGEEINLLCMDAWKWIDPPGTPPQPTATATREDGHA